MARPLKPRTRDVYKRQSFKYANPSGALRVPCAKCPNVVRYSTVPYILGATVGKIPVYLAVPVILGTSFGLSLIHIFAPVELTFNVAAVEEVCS